MVPSAYPSLLRALSKLFMWPKFWTDAPSKWTWKISQGSLHQRVPSGGHTWWERDAPFYAEIRIISSPFQDGVRLVMDSNDASADGGEPCAPGEDGGFPIWAIVLIALGWVWHAFPQHFLFASPFSVCWSSSVVVQWPLCFWYVNEKQHNNHRKRQDSTQHHLSSPLNDNWREPNRAFRWTRLLLTNRPPLRG